MKTLKPGHYDVRVFRGRVREDLVRGVHLGSWAAASAWLADWIDSRGRSRLTRDYRLEVWNGRKHVGQVTAGGS
jgi:hypothetical protein